MLLNGLYHPPHITIDGKKRDGNVLYLVHHFEGKPLVKDFVANTLLGIEFLWGGPVKLETSEVIATQGAVSQQEEPGPADIRWERVVYTMKGRKLAREVIDG
jgi:stage V sporulation protein R